MLAWKLQVSQSESQSFLESEEEGRTEEMKEGGGKEGIIVVSMPMHACTNGL